jgi:hypothetical protein
MTTLIPKVRQSSTGAVNRDIDSKLLDIVSVKDFGAVGNGTTDDTAAFQAAYNSATANGTILIPQGNYNIGTVTPSSGKNVMWQGLGATNVSSGGLWLTLPGTVLSSPNPTYLEVRQSSGGASDFALINSERLANYTGGTNYYVNANGRFKTSAPAGAKSFEWSVLGIMDNYSTSADGSQNVAGYFQAIKNSTGGTWATTFELQDKLADPVVSSVTSEFDMTCYGTDANNGRIGIHLQCGTTTPGQYSEAGTGILIAVGPTSKFKKGLVFDGYFDYYIYSGNFNTGGGGSVYMRADGYTSLGTQGVSGISNAAFTIGKPSADGLDLYRGYVDSTLYYKVQVNGDVKNNNGVYGTISDVRLKDNIVDATPKLDDLSKVRVVNYTLKNDSKKLKQIGVVADELETIFPGLVDVDSDGYKEVKTSVFVPMLIKAVQELSKKVTDLEQQIANLGTK